MLEKQPGENRDLTQPAHEESQEKDLDQIKKELEAVTFMAPDGVTVERLAEVIECTPIQIRKAADQLADEYRMRNSGLALLPVAGGYQLVTEREMAPLVERFMTVVRKRRLSPAAMETLAIVAYRQPATKPEIEAIRGVDSTAVLSTLIEKKFIRLAGRKKAPGRPLMYATTREFLVHFGLRDLKDLPALSELGRPEVPQEDAQEETPE